MTESEGAYSRREPEPWVVRRVKGRSRRSYPPFLGTVRVLGGLLYLLATPNRRAGMGDFEVVDAGRVSRSGQPRGSGWHFLRERGVRTVVNLRMSDDDLLRLRSLGFGAYLHLPIPDGLPPTDEQALAFLEFATDPGKWSVHVHCLRGVQRTGTMVALYRYSAQGWPLKRALQEANRLFPGIARRQLRWLRDWSHRHPPGEFGRGGGGNGSGASLGGPS